MTDEITVLTYRELRGRRLAMWLMLMKGCSST